LAGLPPLPSGPVDADGLAEGVYGHVLPAQALLDRLDDSKWFHARESNAQSRTWSSAKLPTALHNGFAHNCDMVDARLKAFRDYVDAVMAATGWETPTEVARKSGVAASTVNRPYAKDDIEYLPSLRTIIAISEASGVRPPPELVGGTAIPG